ncbi:MAG: ParA family protein [Acidobacteria bacterium]|nr:ParA family protein [Acidobacteriota bacterium]
MSLTIAVANQKGGVGKTTTTVNLACALSKHGKKTLIIDADPQASATIYLRNDPRKLEAQHQTLYYGLLKEKSLTELVVGGNPALIPSSIMLSAADAELMSEPFSSVVLKEKVNELRDEYDFIIIDTPPNLSLLTINALSAADRVLIPTKAEYLDIMGIPLLFETIQKIQRRGNNRLQVLGILPTLFNAHFSQDRAILEELRASLGGSTRILEPINRSTAFGRSASVGKPILELDPNIPGAQVYYKLAEELITYAV